MKNILVSLVFAGFFGLSNTILINFSIEKGTGKSSIAILNQANPKLKYSEIPTFSRMALPVAGFVSSDTGIDRNYTWISAISGIAWGFIYFSVNLGLLSLIGKYWPPKRFVSLTSFLVSIAAFVALYSASFFFWISADISAPRHFL